MEDEAKKLVHLSFSFRGVKTQDASLDPQMMLRQLGDIVSVQTGVQLMALKLVVAGRALHPGDEKQGALTLHDLGLTGSTDASRPLKVLVLGSTQAEVDHAIAASRDDPLLAPMDVDDRRARRRRRRGAGALPLPTGQYVFASFRALEAPAGFALLPSPQKALALLHRLAADPGIAGVMQARRWRVGLLSEMPPEGKVGVSEMCILGYNVNHGQEISLRLRTDDWRGFRRYDRIRETLIHELAHMVFSEHDNRFKQLNSELTVQAARLDWTRGQGRTVGGGGAGRRESSGEGSECSSEEESGGGGGGRRVGGAADAAAPNAAAAAGAAAQRRAAAAAEAAMEAEAQAALGREEAGGEAQQPAEPTVGGACGPEQCACGACGARGLPFQPPPEQGAVTHAHAPPLAPEAATSLQGDNVASEERGQGAPAGAPAVGSAAEEGSAPGRAAAVAAATEPPSAPAPPAPQAEAAAGDVREPPQPEPLPEEAPMEVDDPEVARVLAAAAAAQEKASAAVRELRAAAGPREAEAALATVEKILRNAQGSADARFRLLRWDNAAFVQRVGRWAPAVALLKVAGFAEEGGAQAGGGGGGATGPAGAAGGGSSRVLRLRRDDPALLWLVLGAVTAELEELRRGGGSAADRGGGSSGSAATVAPAAAAPA